MKQGKALISLSAAVMMLFSACASQADNLEGLTDAQTEQTAQTVHTEAVTVPETEKTVTGAVTEGASEASTAAITVSATEAATTAVATQAATTTAITTTSATQAATTTTQNATEAATEKKEPVIMEYNDNMTTAEVVRSMGLGINLGNTMEACGDWINKNGGVKAYETAWGSPEITKNIIKGYADSGFRVLRIPVAWSNLMGDNYTINKELMDRVKQITQWTVDCGMYAIVNIHWDNGWWEKFPDDKENCMKKYTRIWEQICEGFKGFNGKVMFESLNEEGGWDKLWNRYSQQGDKQASYGLLNEINQKFVDIVRASGGNNGSRHLLIAGYCTDIDLTCDSSFKMPKDPKNRCAVSVHYYTPATFCILGQDADWGKLKTTWGSNKDIKELTKNMDKLKKTFVDKGIPVIIGEYSVCEKQVKDKDSVRLFISTVVKEATERSMCPVLWDVTGDYYDRYSRQFIDQELLRQMKDANANK